MASPKISIIVPIYNVEKYLDRCVRSILGQTLKDIEIILVDDGSPDGCPAMCDEYARQDGRIKVVHKKNAGLGYARNSGLDIATGEYVAFVDSDDYVRPEMFGLLYDVAVRNGLDTCYCGFAHHYPDGSIKDKTEVNRYTEFRGRGRVDSFLLDMVGPEPGYHSDVKYMMCVWKAVYSKAVIDKYEIRFCSERQYVSEDLIFHIDYLSKAEAVGFLPDRLYYYCVNGAVTLSSTYDRDKFGRYKVFLAEVDNRLSQIFCKNDYITHYYRLCFLYLRASIAKEVRVTEGLLEAKRVVNELESDSFFRSMFTDYPYRMLPMKHRILFFLMKHELDWVTVIILKLLTDR